MYLDLRGQWNEMSREFDDSGVPIVNGPSWAENLLTRCTLGLVYSMTQVYLDPGVKVKVKVMSWDCQLYSYLVQFNQLSFT